MAGASARHQRFTILYQENQRSIKYLYNKRDEVARSPKAASPFCHAFFKSIHIKLKWIFPFSLNHNILP